jgi:prophage regulatory protein
MSKTSLQALTDSLGIRSGPKRVLTFPALRAEKGITWTRQRVLQLEKTNKFPRRFWLGSNTIAWWEHEVDAWLDERAKASEALRSDRATALSREGQRTRQRKRKPATAPAEEAA